MNIFIILNTLEIFLTKYYKAHILVHLDGNCQFEKMGLRLWLHPASEQAILLASPRFQLPGGSNFSI